MPHTEYDGDAATPPNADVSTLTFTVWPHSREGRINEEHDLTDGFHHQLADTMITVLASVAPVACHPIDEPRRLPLLAGGVHDVTRRVVRCDGRHTAVHSGPRRSAVGGREVHPPFTRNPSEFPHADGSVISLTTTPFRNSMSRCLILARTRHSRGAVARATGLHRAWQTPPRPGHRPGGTARGGA
ncbi:hypothetical protein [Streptomyces sp. NPDC002845]